MVKFTPVDPSDISTDRLGRRGRVAYPIVKSFLESGHFLAIPDLSEFSRNATSLRVGLQHYINKHGLPIKLFAADGKLHFMRLDILKDGSKNPEWEEPSKDDTPTWLKGGDTEDPFLKGIEEREEVTAIGEITSEEVQRRFREEVGQPTK